MSRPYALRKVNKVNVKGGVNSAAPNCKCLGQAKPSQPIPPFPASPGRTLLTRSTQLALVSLGR